MTLRQWLLLMNFFTSQVVSSEAVIRLLIEKGIFSKQEFFEMMEKANLEMAKMA